jgi:hypothetical protein
MFRAVTTYNLPANKYIEVHNLSFSIVGVCFDLFMMKNVARVLAAEGYNGVRRHAPGLAVRLLRFCSPDLSH